DGRLRVDGRESAFRVAPGDTHHQEVGVVPQVGSNRVVVEAEVDGAPPVTAEALVIRGRLLSRRARRPVALAPVPAAVVAVLAFRPQPSSGPPPTPAAAAPLPVTASCPPAPGPADIPIAGFAYCASTLTVAAGTEVRWVNTDLVAHTVTAVSGS